MNVIREARQLAAAGRPVCVALGMFDGVHLGHQRVLRTTVEDAQGQGGTSVAITFDQHPNTVVAPDHTPALIYTLSQRLSAIARLQIDSVLLIHFDAAFSRQPAGAFINSLAQEVGRLRSISVGRGFTFGHKRSGTVTSLTEMGGALGFTVHDVAPVAWQNEVVSSTRVRCAIRSGDVDLASQMLGRTYSLAGRVMEGQHLGRQLGFPTANLDVSGLVLPPGGVYAGRAHTGAGTYPAVMNVGYRPTLNQSEPRLSVEVHLLDFGGDLYGQELAFDCAQRLRGEKKFASLDELRAQIQKDVALGREVTAQTPPPPP